MERERELADINTPRGKGGRRGKMGTKGEGGREHVWK